MPTYAYRCSRCGDQFEQWQSIHEQRLTIHDDCGGDLSRVLGPVRTHGVGNPGADTRRIDAKETDWSKDGDAYIRLRRQGYQPREIDGCAKLEATAVDSIEIATGGRLKAPDEKVREGMEMAESLGWKPSRSDDHAVA